MLSGEIVGSGAGFVSTDCGLDAETALSIGVLKCSAVVASDVVVESNIEFDSTIIGVPGVMLCSCANAAMM